MTDKARTPRSAPSTDAAPPNSPSRTLHLRLLKRTPNNLPFELTSFVGREQEIAQVKEALTPRTSSRAPETSVDARSSERELVRPLPPLALGEGESEGVRASLT